MMNPELIKQRFTSIGYSCRSQLPSEWTGSYELPSEILKYYESIGPDCEAVETHAEPIGVPSLSRLADNQIGYRTHPKTAERFSEWPDEWIVVADADADPFIYCEGKILFANHGRGEWTPFQMFDSIYELIGSIAAIGVVTHEAVEMVDDAFNILPTHFNNLTTELNEVVGVMKTNLLLDSLGWKNAG